MKDRVGYLGYFLFLQCFGYINQVGGMSLFTGQVKIACIGYSHDIAPVQVFFEYVEHFLLFHHFFKYIRIFFIGDTQQ